MVLTFSRCAPRSGPSSSTSCQCAGSKFSIAVSTSPSSSTARRKATRSSVVHSRSGSPARPQPRSVPVGWLSVVPLPGAGEVVHEVRDDGGRAGLTGETEVLARQHVLVEAESELHRGRLPAKALPTAYPAPFERLVSVQRQLVPPDLLRYSRALRDQHGLPGPGRDNWRSSGPRCARTDPGAQISPCPTRSSS